MYGDVLAVPLAGDAVFAFVGDGTVLEDGAESHFDLEGPPVASLLGQTLVDAVVHGVLGGLEADDGPDALPRHTALQGIAAGLACEKKMVSKVYELIVNYIKSLSGLSRYRYRLNSLFSAQTQQTSNVKKYVTDEVRCGIVYK